MAGMEIQHKGVSGVDDATLKTHIARLSSYRDELKGVVKAGKYTSPEAALVLPSDTNLHKKVTDITAAFSSKSEISDVIVIGMGGSIRGTQAVYDLLVRDDNPTLHAIDTVSADHISSVVEAVTGQAVSINNLVICVVSKSGHTNETIANTNILIEKLSQHFERQDVLDQVAVITQPGSDLDALAAELGTVQLPIPEQISGRFSVLSAVGLLPLSLCGFDTATLLSGAGSMREAALSGRPTSDPAAALAAIIYTHLKENTRILNHFFFTHQADSVGRWVKQLYAESLGKRTNRRGEPVFSGVYPVTTIGPDDLHADYQLQLGGPKNFFTIFVRERDPAGDFKLTINDQGLLPESLSELRGRTLGELHQALASGVMETFRADNRFFVEITVPQFNLERIGQLILLEELVVMYLGHLLEINTFNQPQVEKYKKLAKTSLKEK
jgi:glucose-6-phosphate isomerase